jgi:alkanesulfonate monooxygenase SsuD/methylene tetrahydromethanopterin reductase-like flavin-dependent oxidoreductase (luciferase family)
MAATGKNSTRAAATHCDGLITYLKEGFADQLREFRKAAAEKGRDPDSLEVITEYKLSYAKDYDEAFESTKCWRPTALHNVLMAEVHDPRVLEDTARREVSDEKLKEAWHIMTSIDEATGAIEDLFKSGITKVYVHSSSPDELEFLREFTRKVLPQFSGER